MPKASLILFAVILLAIAGGAIFLVTWDIPAPLEHVEKVLPNDRFP